MFHIFYFCLRTCTWGQPCSHHTSHSETIFFFAIYVPLACQKRTRNPGFSSPKESTCIVMCLFFSFKQLLNISWFRSVFRIRISSRSARFLGFENQSWIMLHLSCWRFPLEQWYGSLCYLILFSLIWSFAFICSWLKHSFLSFTPPPTPPHCVVQPRGKSSQAHPGHPESVPRHRYLSWTLETRDHDGTSLEFRVCSIDTLL